MIGDGSGDGRDSFRQTGFRLFPGFLPPAETARLLALVQEQARFQPVAAKAGMNLSYQVVDGNRLRAELPELFALAAGRLQETAQALVEQPIELMQDPKRSVRIQCYRRKDDGFLWHLDGGAYGALLTLVNTNGGATDVLTPRLSRLLKPVPYLLFPFQRLLELARPTRIVAGPGDLLILEGGTVIHRGVMQSDEGERILLAVSFDPVGRKKSRIWEWIARRLNY
jgi:hypothetical protein